LHLTGVFVGSRGGGFATIRTPDGDVHAFPGGEVAPGIILKQIEGNRVILLASGIQKQLTLQENISTAAATTPQIIPNAPPKQTQAEEE
jgi:hypothetical protein